MSMHLRKILASLLVLLLMTNMLPVGLPDGLHPYGHASAESLEVESPVTVQDEQPAREAASENADDSQTSAPDAEMPDETAEPSQPDPTPSIDATDAPDVTDAPETTGAPIAEPEAQFPAASEDAIREKAAAVVTNVAIALADDPEEPLTNPKIIRLNTGSSRELKLTAVLSYTTPEATSGVKWSTSNAKVAKVSASGLDCTVTGLKAGTVTITATAADGSGKKATLKVTVATLVESITVTKARESDVVVGYTLNCAAAVSPSKANNKAVVWNSENPDIATVSSKGVVKGIAPGEATITATAADGSEVEGTLCITVIPAVQRILMTLDSEEASSASIDINSDEKSILLVAKTDPEEATQAVKWTTSNAKIASIAKDGMNCTVTGVAVGKATITATALDGTGKAVNFTVYVTRLASQVLVTGPSHTMMGGGKMTLTATVSPSKTTDKTVNWVSSDISVATVNNKGQVTAMAVTEPASVTITATAKDGGGASFPYDIQVLPSATAVTVETDGGDPAVVDLNETEAADRTLQLKATVTPMNASQDVTWASSSTKIAKVNSDGLVTGVAVGKATITATAADGSGKKGPLAIVVTRLAKEVGVDGPSHTMIGGGKMTLTATVLPSKTTDKSLSWISSDDNTASVSDKGVVTAKAIDTQATVTITATAKDGSGASGTYEILLKPGAATVTVKTEGDCPSVIDLTEADPADRTLKLVAAVSPDEASGDVTWSSSSTKVAKVNSDGLVTGIAVGSAIITATAADGSGTKGSLTVTVTRLANSIEVTGDQSLVEGKSITLTATVLPSNASNKSVKWISGNEDVATVSGKGVVTAKTVNQQETVTITARTQDGTELEDSRDITVYPAVENVTVQADGEDADTVYINLNDGDKTVQLSAEEAPLDAIQGVSWSSSNTKVAQVNSDGLVTGKGAGSATITATAVDGSGVSGKILVSVAYRALSVKVTGPEELVSGKTAAMTVEVLPKNTANKAVIWSVDDQQTAATISEKGILTALDVDVRTDVTITATAADKSGAYGEWTVAIVPQSGSVTILYEDEDPGESMTVSMKNPEVQLSAVIDPSEAPQDVTWTSSDAKTATVNQDGKVTLLKAGQVAISATATGTTVKDTLLLNIEGAEMPDEIAVDPAEYAGEIDTDITIPLENISLTGGTLQPGALTYSLLDGTTAVGTGRTVRFAQPGRYLLTLVGSYGTAKRECPVTIVVTKDGNAFSLNLDIGASTVYDVGACRLLFAQAEADEAAAVLGADEELSWTIKQTAHDEGVTVLMELENENGFANDVYLTEASGSGSATFRLTASAGGAYEASAVFTVTVVTDPDNLPTQIGVASDAYAGEVGEEITIPAEDLILTGGTLTAADFTWSIWDDLGQVGDGLTVRYDVPGRYNLTLKAAYRNFHLECPVAFVVNKTIQFTNGVRMDSVHPGGTQPQYLGHVVVRDDQLLEGESYAWTLERSGSDAVTVEMEPYTPGQNYVKLDLVSFESVTQDETSEFTLTCTAGQYHKGVLRFSIADKAQNLTGLPTGITYSTNHYEVAVGRTVNIRYADIHGVGTDLPIGAWFDVYDIPWDRCDVNDTEGMRSITFNQPGRYKILPAAGYQGYVWTAPEILVTVGSGVDPAFGLDVYPRTGDIYMDSGTTEDFYAYISAHDTMLQDGEHGRWSLTAQGLVGDAPVELYLADNSDEEVRIFYRNVKAPGEITYKLTYDAGIYHAEQNFVAHVVAVTPAGLPTGCSYPVSKITLNPGDSRQFDYSDVHFTGGTLQPENPWSEFWISENLSDDDMEWNDTGREITFKKAGRYIVEAVAGFGNYVFTYPIVVEVGPSAEVLELNTTQYHETIIEGASDNMSIARIALKNFALAEDETCDWSVERIGSESSDPVSLTIWSDDPASATVDFHLGKGTGSASFLVTAKAGGYTATTQIDLEVVAYNPASLPNGLNSPYEASYPIAVNGYLTFDPSRLNFAEGTVPAGADVWKVIDRHDGDWDQVDCESAGGEAVKYTFHKAGRYILTAVIGIDNHIFWKDISVEVKDEAALDPGVVVSQRFAVAYLNGNPEEQLGNAEARDAILLNGEREDYAWSIVQTGEANVAEITIDKESNDAGYAEILCRMLGGTGTVSYRVRYTAAGGLYAGQSEEHTLTVKDAITGIPDEITLSETRYTLRPGGFIDLNFADIQYDDPDFTLPEGVSLWRNYWAADGDWDSVEQDWDEDGAHLVFKECGYYRLYAVLGAGNIIAEKSITVLVSETDPPLDASLTLKQKFSTAYISGTPEEYLGFVLVGDIDVPDGAEDNFSWSITPVSDGAALIADIAVDDDHSDIHGAALLVKPGSQPGTVSYRVDYTALDGLYEGSHLVNLTVEAAPPANLPTGITYADSVITIQPGEEVTLDPTKISLVGGAISTGVASWNEFWLEESNIESIDASWDEDHTLWKAKFPQEGVAIVKAALGVGNYVLTCDIQVRVLSVPGSTLDAKLNYDGRFTTAWLDAVNDDFIGNVYTRDVVLGSDDRNFYWDIEPVSGADVAQMYLNKDDANKDYVSVHFHLKGAEGMSRWKVIYTALDGIYKGEYVVSLDVKAGGIANMPAGIHYEPSTVRLQTGGSYTFNLNEIDVDGTLPQNGTIWRDLWTDEGDWDSVQEEWNDDGTLRTRIFKQPGRYLANVVLGVDNYVYTTPVTIIVLNDGQTTLDAGLYSYRHEGPMYLGRGEDAWVCDTYAMNAAMTEKEKRAAQWHVELLEGQDVCELRDEMITWTFDLGRQVMCSLKGVAGHVKFRISYSALDGLYTDSEILEFDVANAPENAPTGITFPTASFTAKPGVPLAIDLNQIQFTGGSFAEDVPLWYDLWTGDGDWDSVKIDDDEDVMLRTITFTNEGQYIFTMHAGANNYDYETGPIVVTVLADGNDHVNVEFDSCVYVKTVYTDGDEEGWMGDIDLRNVCLTDAQQKEANWTLTPEEGGGLAQIFFEINDYSLNSRRVLYRLKNGGTGHVKYRLDYSSANELYRGTTYIEFDVAAAPENLPTGIELKQDSFTIHTGESLTLDGDNIQFVDGSVSQGANYWWRILNDAGNWDNVDTEWGEANSARTDTFREAGRYIVRYDVGIGNRYYNAQASITVLDNGQTSLDPDLRVYQGYTIAYENGDPECWLGDAYPESAVMSDAEKKDAVWTLTPLDGTDFAEVYLEVKDGEPESRRIQIRLKSGCGHVKYQLDYSAVNGLYQDSAFIEFDVASALTDRPTGIAYADPVITIHPGGQAALERDKIQFLGGNVPAGVDYRFQIWKNEGDWGSVQEEWNQDETIQTNTFSNVGRYLLDVAVRVGNYTYDTPVAVNVLPEGQDHFSAGFNKYQRTETVYVDADRTHDVLADIYANGTTLTEEERKAAVWDFEQTEGADVATVTCDPMHWNSNGRHLEYTLKGITGQVQCKITYSAGGGAYRDVIYVNLDVQSALADPPTGITYPETSFRIQPGEQVKLNKNEIQFTGGTIPSGTATWTEIWNDQGNWDSTEESWNKDNTIRTNTFPKEGRYTLNMAAGIGNYVYTVPVMITVVEDSGHLTPTLDATPRSSVLYTGGSQEDYLGDANVNNMVLTEAEEGAASWILTPVSGSDIATVDFDGSRRAGNRVLTYKMKGGTGHVKYRLDYSAASGLYQASTLIEFDVKTDPENLPTGITYPQMSFNIKPGGTVSLDLDQIAFAGGEVPNEALWRQIWNDQGDWGSVTETWNSEGNVRTNTFENEGRYTLNMAAGIGNYVYTVPVMITVVEDSGHLTPTLDATPRSSVLYTGGSQEDYLGDANVNNMVLTEAEEGAASWILTPVSGSDIATVDFDGSRRAGNRVLTYKMKGGTGHVKYRLDYSAASGLYQASTLIEFDVKTDPENLPTGITYPQTSFNIKPGGTVSLDLDQIAFVGGEVPNEALWRQIWNDQGDWSNVTETWNSGGNIRTNTFPSEGRYVMQVVAGAGNYTYFAQVYVTVLAEDSGHLTLGARRIQEYNTLYLSGSQEDAICDIYLDVGSLSEAEQQGIVWKITQQEGASVTPVTLEDMDWNPYGRRVKYALHDVTGTVKATVSYATEDGLFQGATDVQFTVEPGLTGIPTGITYPTYSIAIKPGEQVFLQKSLIQFAGGDIPDDAAVWRNFWDDSSNWGSVQVNWNADQSIRTNTFPSEGVYQVKAAGGIGNHVFTQIITITVAP